MATVQVKSGGRVVVFQLAGESGETVKHQGELMRGSFTGQLLYAVKAVEVPSLRTRISKPFTFDTPRTYSDGSSALPNTGKQRRFIRIQAPGRTAMWLRFTRPIDKQLLRELNSITAPTGEKEKTAMSKVVKTPGGMDPTKGHKTPRPSNSKLSKIPGSKAPSGTDMSRGWAGKKG